MAEEDTSIRISREEKQALDAARNAWERQNGRRISAGEFVRYLAGRYLDEVGGQYRQSAHEPSGAGDTPLVAAQEVRPPEPEAVTPGPQVFLVGCVRCGRQIAWRMDFGLEGRCPYCGVPLRLMV